MWDRMDGSSRSVDLTLTPVQRIYLLGLGGSTSLPIHMLSVLMFNEHILHTVNAIISTIAI